MGRETSLDSLTGDLLNDSHRMTNPRDNPGPDDAVIETFEDLQHQLHSPIIRAHMLARRALDAHHGPADLERDMRVIHGLLAKARRIFVKGRLLTKLSRGESIEPQLTRMDRNSLLRLISELADDVQQTESLDRNIRFHVDKKSFDKLRNEELMVDRDLLEQVIGNLFDNAIKYSYRDTVVSVVAVDAGAGRFALSVKNKGLSIKKEQLDHVVERGWRSDEARAVVGEGSGIGLWIVNQVMRAHAGKLEVLPTQNDETEFRLVLPTRSE
jgi:signal transduction histidine kinase